MPYAGYRDYFEEPVVLSVAPTGGIHGKEANPNLPEQPDEIIEDVVDCYEAGASVYHVHARDEDGNATQDVSKFQELVDLVQEHVPEMVVNFTTGGRASKAALLRPSLEVEPRPDVATIDLGPMNMAPELTVENTTAKNERYARKMREAGVKPELETFNPGQLTEAWNLIEKDLLDPPYWFTLIFGMPTGTVPSPRNLLNFVDNLPERANWQCMAIGRHQLPLTTMAMTLGGHVRVGLEDNVYYRKGELAESNAQLVERTVEVAERLERPVATPEQARDVIGLD